MLGKRSAAAALSGLEAEPRASLDKKQVPWQPLRTSRQGSLREEEKNTAG